MANVYRRDSWIGAVRRSAAVFVPGCKDDPGLCYTQETCESAGWDWCGGMTQMCNDEGSTCGNNVCECCGDQSSCESASCWWDGDMTVCLDYNFCEGMGQSECASHPSCTWSDPNCVYGGGP